jgi:hypothetical protein
MDRIGTNSDFANIWHAIGCEEFVPIVELGSKPLTI